MSSTHHISFQLSTNWDKLVLKPAEATELHVLRQRSFTQLSGSTLSGLFCRILLPLNRGKARDKIGNTIIISSVLCIILDCQPRTGSPPMQTV